jgi:hypothetical protein
MGGEGKYGAEEDRDRRQEQGTLQEAPEPGRFGQRIGAGREQQRKAPRKRTSQHSGAVSSFANLKVPELRRRAKKAGVKGRSTMNKKQLIKALRGA